MCSHYATYLSHHHNTASRRRQSINLSSSLVSMCLVVKCLTVRSLAFNIWDLQPNNHARSILSFCCRFDIQLCECETSQPVRILVLFYSKAFLAYLGDVQSPQEPLIGDPIISKNPKFVFFPFSFLFLRD